MTTAEQDAFEERLRRRSRLTMRPRSLYAAVKLGLPDRMATRPRTPEQLAGALGLSAPHLHRFLRGLCTIGFARSCRRGIRA